MTDPAAADTLPRWTEFMPVASLTLALDNEKRHDLPYLRDSLERFGFIENIILDERDGRLLGGHGRVEMMDLLERLDARPDDWPTVYDPFAGSGSVLIAAHQLGRRCLSAELDPGYCDVILQRWEQQTGISPVQASTNEAVTFLASA